MRRSRRQMAGEECHTLGALEHLDLMISEPLNEARIAYKGLDHPPERRSSRSRNAGFKTDAAEAG